MTPVDRVTSRRAFASLQRTPHRARKGPVRVSFAPVSELPVPASSVHPQVAYAINRRFGGAVQRNRVRRRLRSAIRERRAPLAMGMYLVTVAPAAATERYSDLAHDLDLALDQAASAASGRGARASR